RRRSRRTACCASARSRSEAWPGRLSTARPTRRAGRRPEAMDAEEIHHLLVQRFGDAIVGAALDAATPFAVVATHRLLEGATFCQHDPALALGTLMCLSGVDYPKETPPRLEVVYHLFSHFHFQTFALKVQLPRENPS